MEGPDVSLRSMQEALATLMDANPDERSIWIGVAYGARYRAVIAG